jgi:hypothetical protein
MLVWLHQLMCGFNFLLVNWFKYLQLNKHNSKHYQHLQSQNNQFKLFFSCKNEYAKWNVMQNNVHGW